MDREDPFDVDIWRQMLLQMKGGGACNRLLRCCPSAFFVATILASRELDAGNLSNAEAVFHKFLLASPFSDLWVLYTDVVIASKLTPALSALQTAQAGGGGAARTQELQQAVTAGQRAVLDAFEFAVDHVGASFDSGPLWRAYLLFINSLPTDNAYAAGHAREQRRKAFGKAVAGAHDAVDELWDQYCAFERESNQAKLAESFITQRSADQGTASAVYKERTALWARVDVRRLAIPPPSVSSPQFKQYSDEVTSQLSAWRRIIAYERNNPLMLNADAHDKSLRLAFRQALACLRYCPDMWHDYALFLGTPKAAEAYAEALEIMPTCISLISANADAHEIAGQSESASAVYRNSLLTFHALAEGRHGIWRTAPAPSIEAPVLSSTGDDEELAPGMISQSIQHSAGQARSFSFIERVMHTLDGTESTLSPTLLLCRPEDEEFARRAITHLFILHQRLARRSENVDAARAVFAAARKSQWCTPLAYVSSAQLEYASNRALPVARNILEAARKRWPADVELACMAIDFLAPLDESTNVRAFVEACLAAVPPSNSRPIWDRFIAYELSSAQGGGSMAAVAAIERRRAAVHTHLTGYDASSLLRIFHRQAVFLRPGDPSVALSTHDAEFLSREPYSPFHTLNAPAQLVPREGLADRPPTVDTATALLLGADALTRQRDGLYLQAPPLFAGLLAHVRAADAISAHTGSQRVAAAEGLQHGSTVGVQEDGQGSRSFSAAGEPPMLLHGLLMRLPCFDPSAGPPPPVDHILTMLTGSSAAATAAQRGVKRPREDDGGRDAE